MTSKLKTLFPHIVEGKWSAQFCVSKASIREAINILAQSGFVTKVPGRSARVIHLSETDAGHMHLLPGAIENAICLADLWTPMLEIT